MEARYARVYVTSGLFLGWLSWLFYLVLTTTRPVVLSRPQFLVSTYDLVARVRDSNGNADPRVLVEAVHWPPRAQKTLVGRTIEVKNLPQCSGWEGPGSYILAAVRDESGSYRVAEIPPSPGFDPFLGPPPRVYPATPQTIAQLDRIHKAVGAKR